MKRILSLILAMAIALSCVQLPVFASEVEGEEAPSVTQENPVEVPDENPEEPETPEEEPETPEKEPETSEEEHEPPEEEHEPPEEEPETPEEEPETPEEEPETPEEEHETPEEEPEAPEEQPEGPVYALTRIPFDEFYAFLDNDVAVDAVTSATTGKCRSNPNVYYTEDATISGGTDVLGIVAPVEMTAAEAEAAGAEVLTETPAVYLEQTADGYVVVGEQKVIKDVAATITSATNWGDYQIKLADSSLGMNPADVYGVYLTTSDSMQYALRQGENLWNPRSLTEFAFSTGHKTTEPHGCVLHGDHYQSIEGKTITRITFITTEGVVTYRLEDSLFVAPNSGAALSAELTGYTTLKVAELPAGIRNARVSVSTGGRGAVYLAQNAKIVNGAVTLSQPASFGTNYTVTVTSSNFAAITATVQLQAEYVLMNIPYAAFYAAEGDDDVDAVASATKNKPLTGTLTGGSYHVNSDGTDITGVVYPVRMTAEELEAMTGRLITDEDSLEITVTNRGQTITTVYEGKDALYGAGTYAYYVLGDAPASCKPLTVKEDGSYAFGAVVGEVTESAASASIVNKTNYGDYQINVRDAEFANDTVYGVVLTDAEGNAYGLRHLENIWRVTSLAFSTGHTTQSHGSPLSYANYAALEGATITGITYYTSSGIYHIATDLYAAPIKAVQTVTAEKTSFTKTLGKSKSKINAATDGDGELTYTSSDTAVAKVSRTGYITAAGVGTAVITVTAAETDACEAAALEITVKVRPAGVELTGVASTKAGKVKVQWTASESTDIRGYQIECNGVKTSVAGAEAVSKTLSGLTSGEECSVRIRTYQRVYNAEGTEYTVYYSAWSEAETVTVK